MKYTGTVMVMSKIADALDDKEMVKTLKELRKYSDIAELIGRPKNREITERAENVGHTFFEQENERFGKFKMALDRTQEAIFDVFQKAGHDDFYQKNVRGLYKGDMPDMSEVKKVADMVKILDFSGASPSSKL